MLAYAIDRGGGDVVGPIRQLRELGGDRDRVLRIAQVRVHLDARRRMGLLIDRHGHRVARLQVVLDDQAQRAPARLLPQETRNYVPAVLSAMQLLGVSYLPVEPRQTAKRSDPIGIIFAVPGAQP